MNINTMLVKFAQDELVLSRNEIERNKIIASLEQLEKVLKNKLGNKIKGFIRFGSFTRNTILPRKYDSESDVDLMVVFDTSIVKYSPGTYRKWISDVITTAYPNSVSKKDFPVVKLLLNHIMFDIVPAYSEMSWGSVYYYIPGAGENWRSTVPNDINSSLKTKNASYGDNIIRNTIRLCKHWNASAGYPLESYLMEKEILNLFHFSNNNTYEIFLSTLENIAGHKPGVAQALRNIDQYKGGIWKAADESKQLLWLQKLLPGLK